LLRHHPGYPGESHERLPRSDGRYHQCKRRQFCEWQRATNDTLSADSGNIWTLIENPAHGTVNFNPDGSYTYTPDADYYGMDTLGYRLCDSVYPNQDCSDTTLVIRVKAVNDYPVAMGDTISVNEDSSVSGSVATNDTLSADSGNIWSLIENPAHGTVNFNIDGSYTYTPDADYYGMDTLRYELCDSVYPNQDCSDTTLVIRVKAMNDYPVAMGDTVNVLQDSSIKGSVSLNDTLSHDGGNIWILKDSTKHGTVVFQSDGSYVYTPDAYYFGMDTFEYELCDSVFPQQDCDRAIVSIIVNEVNQPPVCISDTVSTGENIPVDYNPVANDYDPDGELDTGSMTIVCQGNGTVIIDTVSGKVTYMPCTDWYGIDTIVICICDNNNPAYCSNDTAIITVIKPNIVAIDDSYKTSKDNSVQGNVSDNDTLYSCLSGYYELDAAGAGYVVINTDGTFVYVPDEGVTGVDTFTYKVVDCNGEHVTAVVTITVMDDCAQLFIPEIFSPNNDGKNDYFKIKCIENYPDAKIKIYNRWGQKVYEKEHYGNIDVWGTTEAWWNGYSNQEWIVGMGELTSSTYFYVLDLKDGSKPYSGFIYLYK